MAIYQNTTGQRIQVQTVDKAGNKKLVFVGADETVESVVETPQIRNLVAAKFLRKVG